MKFASMHLHLGEAKDETKDETKEKPKDDTQAEEWLIDQ